MIIRTYDADVIDTAVEQYRHKMETFDSKEWLERKENIALVNDYKDVAMFAGMLPSVVIGHYFFHSRGKYALIAAKEMLREIFSGSYDVKVIEGLTPLENLGARWMNKKLGFKSYGVVDTTSGPCEVVILTKDEWRLLNG